MLPAGQWGAQGPQRQKAMTPTTHLKRPVRTHLLFHGINGGLLTVGHEPQALPVIGALSQALQITGGSQRVA